MPTLVLGRRYTPDSNALWRAAIAAGWDVERLQSPEPPPELRAREPVLYTDTFYASHLAGALGLALVSPPLDWLCALPERHRRRAARLLPWSAAHAEAGPAFFKPADDKWFPARVYASGAAIPAPPEYEPDAPVLVQEPVRFSIEFRLFVLDRAVAAHSIYIRDGARAEAPDGSWPCTPGEEAAALGYARELLADPEVALPEAVVVDVGLCERGWCAVEANPAWAAGLCGCDPAAVLPVLRRASGR